jgi:hypothetical protein
MLQFVNKLPSTIFTGGKIEAEDDKPVTIVLMDANTNTIVTSGPLASLKIEIVPLDADFGSDDQEDWTEAEFTARVIREREGRRPLVTGDLAITLRDGVGQLGDMVFTDNSSWQRSRKFRLGARPVQKVSDETRIREGRSEAFVVKDHRGEGKLETQLQLYILSVSSKIYDKTRRLTVNLFIQCIRNITLHTSVMKYGDWKG